MCLQTCASFSFDLIDSVQTAVAWLNNGCYGNNVWCDRCICGNQDTANHKGHTWIWRKRWQIDSWTIQRIKTQYETDRTDTVDEHINTIKKGLLNANKLEQIFQSMILFNLITARHLIMVNTMHHTFSKCQEGNIQLHKSCSGVTVDPFLYAVLSTQAEGWKICA